MTWKIQDNDSFYKSLECSKISQQQLQERLNNSGNSNLTPESAFFSKTHNSCLFVAINEKMAWIYKESPQWTTYLFDYNNNKNLSVWLPTNSVDFYKKIKEFKWE